MRPAKARCAGHFGELLQGRLGPEGPVCLVTLPAPGLRVTASLRPGTFGVLGAGGRRMLRPGQVRAVLRALGRPPSGRLVLRADMPPGGGSGSSTAALVACARACVAAWGLREPDAGRLAELCLALEGATDPLMFPHPARLLWAPRQARCLAALPDLPRLDVVGGFLGPGTRTDPRDVDFADVSDLVAAWAPAAARGDLASLAGLATQSALRNSARRGGPDPAPLLTLAGRLGALGIVAAHTGSARGLVFPPGRPDIAAARDALRAIGVRQVGHFRLGGTAGAS